LAVKTLLRDYLGEGRAASSVPLSLIGDIKWPDRSEY
jgi:hypothetical protein